MHKRNSAFFTFFVFLILSLVLLLLSQLPFFSPISKFLGYILIPAEKLLHTKSEEKEIVSPQIQNSNLLKEIEEYKKENSALKDQFHSQTSKQLDLLPAVVVGEPTFIPHVTPLELMIISRGSDDGVKVGQAVIASNMVVGKVVKTSRSLSIVYLVTHPLSSFAVKTGGIEALGVVKGQGSDELLLENVLISEPIKKGDLVMTKGDVDGEGVGYPPNIVVGKIISIDKKPSSLFQSAKVKSILDFSKLSTVFVVLGLKNE